MSQLIMSFSILQARAIAKIKGMSKEVHRPISTHNLGFGGSRFPKSRAAPRLPQNYDAKPVEQQLSATFRVDHESRGGHNSVIATKIMFRALSSFAVVLSMTAVV